MKLQGRNLELHLRGDDVALLQSELRQLGIPIADPTGIFGSTTLLAVQRFQTEHRLPVTGIVDARTARLINQAIAALGRERWRVAGRVLQPDGSPVTGARVRAFEKHLRREDRLGEATTERNGRYQIDYAAPAGGDLSLIVRAIQPDGTEIAASTVLCHARPVETVDLIAGNQPLRGAPLFARLQTALRPRLTEERVSAADLSAADVDWLACRLDLDAEALARFADAARLARDAQLPREHEALFGLVMQTMPTVLEGLIAQSPATLRLALERAIADNMIDAALAARVPQIIAALQAVIVRLALREPTSEQATFRQLFELAGTRPEHHEPLLTDYIHRQGTMAEFWDAQRARLGREAVDELQQVVRLAALTLHHEPLLRELLRRRDRGDLGPRLEGLARLNREDWHRLLEETIDGRRIGAPAFFGSDEAQRLSVFASFLTRYIEAGSPTRVLVERLATDTPPAAAPALQFLRRNPDFDFRSQRVAEFLRANPAALEGDPDPAATRTSLESIQRLWDIAPPFEKHRTVRLVAQGIQSATQIRRLGESAFVELAAATLGTEDDARAVYVRAAHKADLALMLLSQTAFLNPTPVNAVPPQLLGPGVADLEDLFGSLDSCQCRHCASVYSPAAYLVDLLHFLLNQRSEQPGRSALDVLLQRRPDIGEVDLNCGNTDTPLPYVDLVVEILENAVAPGGNFPFQTEGDPADLLASPEHVHLQAYDGDHLAGAVYPWNLPFDLWTEMARTYLQHLGVPRHELMQRFRAASDPDRSVDIAAELLRLTPLDRQALVDATAASRRRHWGFDNAADLNQMLSQRNASVILERSRMNHDELVAALNTSFVNSAGNLRIVYAGADCNLETATITGFNAAAADRLQRFARLHQRLEWSIEELGALLAGLQISSTVNDEALLRLADVQRLNDTLHAPLSILLGWWAQTMDTGGIGREISLYDRVFLDPSASQPAAEVFRLNAARTELAQADSALISAHLPQVHAALGISATDLQLLLPNLPDDRLNLRNLTRLHATVSLARALELNVTEFLILRALSGIDPVGPAAATATTTRFVDLTRQVRDGGFSLPLLDYLLRHRFVANATFALTDQEIADRLSALRTAMRAADAELALAPPGVDTTTPGFEADPDGTRTTVLLAQVLPADAVNRALALIRRDPTHAPADPEDFVRQEFARFTNADEAVDRLVGPEALTEAPDRFNYVLSELLSHLRLRARERLAITSVAEANDIEAVLAEALMRDLVRSPADHQRPILADLLEDDFVGSPNVPPDTLPPIDRATFPALFSGQLRIHKLVQAITLFDLEPGQIRFAVEQGPDRGWPNIAALPLAAEDSAQSAFESWLALSRALRAGVSLPGGLADFFDLLTRQDEPGIDRARYLDEVALRTGWDRPSLDFITGAPALGLNWPEDFRSGVFLSDLHLSIAQLHRLGVTAETAQSWSGATVDAVAARTIVQAARARYPDKDAWLGVARPLRDPLRERQRTALVDYLVHEHGARSPSDLYGRYLVDVEMSPCMLTSRLVLATASVQLFVQRCLLNLEADVRPSAIDTQQWNWMKNYRVWEANRKVFLYPENWIEPELRDDKSPFFVALEQGLLQDEISASSVEREYLRYLEALDQVANLEISALHVGKWGLESNVVHVFARTRNTPRHYFYRRWAGSAWTAWEPLEVGIEGDHLVPVLWNGRLNLFWPTFLEKAGEPTSLDPDTPSQPQKYYEVKLAWSEYREGAWSPKRVTEESMETSVVFALFGPPEVVRFHEPIGNHSFVSSTTSDGSIEIGTLLRLAGNDPQADPNELALAQAFRLTAIGDIEIADSLETQSRQWAPSRRFPATRLFRNKIREVGGHSGFSAHTTSSSIHAAEAALVLENSPGRFSVVYPQAERPFFCRLPFFYQDPSRSFFVVPDGRYLVHGGNGVSLGSDFAISPPTTHSTPAPEVSLDLPARVVAFHANAATAILASGSTPASSPAGSPALPGHWETTRFLFAGHHHPFVRVLIEQLQRFGIDGILKPDARMEPSLGGTFQTLRRQALFRPYFWADYAPNREVVENVRDVGEGIAGLAQIAALQPRDDFDFTFGGAYSIYNWELFFHAPFLIAKRLSANRRFEEAHRWFNFIFDPTDAPSDPEAESAQVSDWAWNVKPFVEHGRGQTIERWMLLLSATGLSAADQQRRRELNDEVKAWRKNPFNPHLIARLRIQPYMMAVVMAYLDNLIAWADDLFRRDTMESINQASQLYILAAEVLGDRPRDIAAHEGTRRVIDGQVVTNFNDLRPHLDAFSNALVTLEGILYPGEADQGMSNSGGLVQATDFVASSNAGNGLALDLDFAAPVPAVVGPTLFFCIPRNEKLAGYWDTVADRLFKIRHCMNIEGVVRQLPLFQPPIDPALLVKAAASGVDLGSALADLGAPLPSYRFPTLLQKARDLAASLKALGGALLSTLEKSDAEELALLRARHESELLSVARLVREKAIEEARANLDALLESKATVEFRRTFFASREHTNAREQLQQKKLENAFALQTTSQALELLVGALALIPQFDVGVSGAFGTPVVKVEVGGVQLSTAVQVVSRALQLAASVESYRANKAAIEGGYDRRQEDWDFQADTAELEKAQIDKQIDAARIRLAMAEHELKNHDLQVRNSQSVEAYLRDKYTNQELYGWMIGQLSSVHFQAHQLALDLARRAERCYRRELGLQESTFIGSGHWDNLRKGLLAGEKLELDLQRLEAEYLHRNTREYELTKHVSLRQLDPLALLALKGTGRCEFDMPEWLFDLDGPGHYFRRLKTLSLSLPCVVGPYASVNCTASLLSSSVRIAPLVAGGYARNGEDSTRFLDSFGTIHSVVTSGASNDSGMFETNLRDERYLPFEGSGAVSRWRLELPGEFRQFDFGTIADVILHVRYTAREGGSQLRDAAIEQLAATLAAANQTAPVVLLGLRNDYPGEWQRFLGGDPLAIGIGRNRFSYIAQGRTIAVQSLALVTLTDAPPVPVAVSPQELGLDAFPTFDPSAQDEVTMQVAADSTLVPRDASADPFLLLRYAIL